MKTILAIIQPFQIMQKVYVKFNNDLIEMKTFPLEKVYEDIVILAKKNNTKDIILTGSAVYNQHIKEEIEAIDETMKVKIS